ncbi:MAG: hypothetical protein AB1746_00070 [Candidatus Zixiibacteriota bacterium]
MQKRNAKQTRNRQRALGFAGNNELFPSSGLPRIFTTAEGQTEASEVGRTRIVSRKPAPFGTSGLTGRVRPPTRGRPGMRTEKIE